MIIFLYGEDDFRSRKKLKELKEKFQKEIDEKGLGIDVVDGENANLEEIKRCISSTSLLANKKMIIIEKIFGNKNKELKNKIYEYLKNKKDTKDIIIFWDDVTGEKLLTDKLFSFLSKQKITQNFKTLSNTETSLWLKKECEKRGAKIYRESISLLIGLFGSNLWQLNNEINKLINYKRGLNKTLDINRETQEIEILLEDINLICRGRVDENIFALTDAISNKNKSRAIELFEKELEAGVSDVYLLQMILRQFKILMQIKSGVEQGHTSRKIISDLKIHPFVVQKALNQTRNFSLPFLKNIFKKLIEIDEKIKSGKTEGKSALELLIIKI